MKNRELIARLQEMNPDADVAFLSHIELKDSQGKKTSNAETFLIGQVRSTPNGVKKGYDGVVYILGDAS